MIIDKARKWIGVPFCFEGRTKEQGVDCAGLILGVAQELGLYQNLKLPRYPEYFDESFIMNLLNFHLQPKALHDLAEGDVGVFCPQKSPRHLAFLTHSSMIHASEPLGRVVEEAYNPYYLYRVFSFK
jgi:cell wall-associated NlpC family hydrolase